MSQLTFPSQYFVNKLRNIQTNLRDYLRDQLNRQNPSTLAEVAEPREGDTIYNIDEKGEALLLDFCREWGKSTPFILIAEGLPGSGWKTFPEGSKPENAQFMLIVDPIDGTRAIMYDKRSAWILMGIAPNRGVETRLTDIEIAMQTEVPTTRHYLGYQMWAVKGQGAHAEMHDLIRSEVRSEVIKPSSAPNLEHGFSSIVKFFPASKREIVEIESQLFEAIFGDINVPNPLVFDDEYISTGGQLYELMVGHDRFIADLRPVISPKLKDGLRPLCAHPYDICTELIAREAGVIITDEWGKPVNSLLDIREDVAWIGYANEKIRNLVEPKLLPLIDTYRKA